MRCGAAGAAAPADRRASTAARRRAPSSSIPAIPRSIRARPGRAIRYGVGVGREGFTWAGVQTISRKAEWPDWHPPAEMIARQPYLPRFMAGGPGNPLGARAMYLGTSEYRIHGTNDPTTIGKFVSSGCIRLTNEDVSDLFSRVDVGTKVVVLPKNAPHMARRGGDPVRGRAGGDHAALGSPGDEPSGVVSGLSNVRVGSGDVRTCRSCWRSGGVAVLAGACLAPAAQAGGFLLGNVRRIRAGPAPRSGCRLPNDEMSRSRRRGQRAGYGGGGPAFCVRICDGRYFPIAGNDAEHGGILQQLLSASETQVVYGSDIDDAATDNRQALFATCPTRSAIATRPSRDAPATARTRSGLRRSRSRTIRRCARATSWRQRRAAWSPTAAPDRRGVAMNFSPLPENAR